MYPLHALERPFTEKTEVYLYQGLGTTADTLPRWAWNTLEYYDQLFSPELKCELMIAGGIICRK